ncbi:hypothetical protein [Micromonospora sp. RV43]|uniref:hypothetical protein n=1 Tax=Micromonospora sp. RV43 TaxID=1661387 RepID=UPI00064C16CF|nr:hypothetical protein [Micromonospora sp. RV43]
MATSPTAYTPDQLTELLVAGATCTDRNNISAAVHLITFTSLPHRARFGELLDVDDVDGPDGLRTTAAFVRDWKTLPDSPAADRLASGDQRLIALAVSLATGEPVDLRDNASVGGHAYARRVIEAIAIATGYAEHYEITPTAKLHEMLAARDALLA